MAENIKRKIEKLATPIEYLDIHEMNSIVNGRGIEDRVLKRFGPDRFSNPSVIYLDGTCCVGKTNILSNFPNDKVNNYLDDQEAIYYNQSVNAAHSYVLVNKIINDESKNLAVDRSIFSNLAFQYVYYIMFHSKRGIQKNTMRKLCQEFTNMHNLTSVLEYINGLRHHILILIDSNIDVLMQRAINRSKINGNSNKQLKLTCREYYEAQNAVYIYMADIFNLDVYDLEDYRPKNGSHKQTEDETFTKFTNVITDYMGVYIGNGDTSVCNLPKPATSDESFESGYINMLFNCKR